MRLEDLHERKYNIQKEHLNHIFLGTTALVIFFFRLAIIIFALWDFQMFYQIFISPLVGEMNVASRVAERLKN